MQSMLRPIRKLDQFPLYWPLNIPLVVLLFISNASGFQMTFWLIAINFLVFAIIKATSDSEDSREKVYQQRLKSKIPKSRKSYYQASNLSESEIAFFRAEMAEGLANIDTILGYINYNTHLSMLFKRYDTEYILKNYFQQITKAPGDLNQATDFLYQLLPQMRLAVEKYVAVNQNMDTSSKKVQKLSELREEIAGLAEQVQGSYENFNQAQVKGVS